MAHLEQKVKMVEISYDQKRIQENNLHCLERLLPKISKDVSDTEIVIHKCVDLGFNVSSRNPFFRALVESIITSLTSRLCLLRLVEMLDP